MEETDNLIRQRIHASDIGTLVTIAVNTSQCEIVCFFSAPVLACNHMVYLKRRRMKTSQQLAVFASPTRPVSHKPIKVCVQTGSETLSNFLARDCMRASRLPT